MLKCIKCLSALDTRTGEGGLHAHCESCDIHLITLGRLIKIADPQLVTQFWGYVQSSGRWKKSGTCPRCSVPLSRVEFFHHGTPHLFHACQSCFILAMNQTVLDQFAETQRELREKERLQLLMLQAGEHGAALRHFMSSLFLLAKRSLPLLLQTPIAEARLTTTAIATIFIFGAITTLVPFSAVKAFGFPAGNEGTLEASIIFSLLTHVDAFHLLTSLYFWIQIGPKVERAFGTLKLASILGFSILMSYGLTPSLGLSSGPLTVGSSPLIATLLALAWVRSPNDRISVFPGSTTKLSLNHLIMLFVLIEMRSLIPNPGLPSWSSLPYSLWGLFIGLVAGKLLIQTQGSTPEVFAHSSVRAAVSQSQVTPQRAPSARSKHG